MMKKEIFEMEKEKLQTTIKEIDEVICAEQTALDDLKNYFHGTKDDLLYEEFVKKTRIKNLEESKDKPYFARIDFDSEIEKNIAYIGKNGINLENKIIVTDWRAPISSLYYNHEVGKCKYIAPDEEIDGELKLKRQFEIEDSKLIHYFDVDLVSTDALLQKYLNSNNDTRIKSIVSTIQKEQNEVM